MKSKLSRIPKDLRAQRESIYGRRMVNMILFGSPVRGDAMRYSAFEGLSKEKVWIGDSLV